MRYDKEVKSLTVPKGWKWIPPEPGPLHVDFGFWFKEVDDLEYSVASINNDFAKCDVYQKGNDVRVESRIFSNTEQTLAYMEEIGSQETEAGLRLDVTLYEMNRLSISIEKLKNECLLDSEINKTLVDVETLLDNAQDTIADRVCEIGDK